MLNTAALTVFILLGQPAQDQYNTSLDFHLVHQFSTPIDGGGRIEMTRSGFDYRLNSKVTDDNDLQFRFQFQRDQWNFKGAGLADDDPWSEINTLDFSLQMKHKYSQTTQWFSGATIRSSFEDEIADGLVAGANIGFVHSSSRDFAFGLGIGVIEQELEDPRFFPIFILDWILSDALRLTTDLSTKFGSRTGVELIWEPRNDWTLGAGLSYEYSRFRLDDSGIAPNGAGEATAFPLTLRATWRVSPTFDLTVYGGLVFSGHLEVVNANKAIIRNRDYDTTGSIGILGQFKF
ncbi:MAG: hypothetical protein VX436_00270 [Planctomycetota bacterium]|nr:hypothetical protein [Planctomycetota bacterium]